MTVKATLAIAVVALMTMVGVARADISIGDVTKAEGSSGGATTFEFALTDPDLVGSDSVCTVPFSTSDGSAFTGEDYFGSNGAVGFDGSATSVNIDVVADTFEEADETFTVHIDGPVTCSYSSGTLEEPVADDTGVGTILDDDGPCNQPGVIRGTAGNDKLTGTNGPDVICGLGGNDTIKALSGDDQVYGGSGDDTIDLGTGDNGAVGGDGADRITGGKGDDSLDGGTGPDKLSGGAGNDNFMAGPGNDIVTGGAGSDTGTGDEGDDVMQGGDGDDTFSGGDAQDKLFGENGNDTLDGGDGNDSFVGGKNIDICAQGSGIGSRVGCES